MSKRLFVLLLALTMMFSIAACGSSSDNDDKGEKSIIDIKTTNEYDEAKYNAPGTYPIFKEKQTITVQLPANVNVENYDTNTQTLLMEERLNADLVIEAVPSKEYKTKVNLMVASGGDDLADTVLGTFTDSEVYSYAQNDAIAPVTDFYYNTAIAVNLHEALNRLGWNFFPQVTMPDGEIYGIASINEAISNVNPDKLFVYGPWLEKLNIKDEDIKTPEDFKEMLRAIKNDDPNGNGQSDEIPLTSSSTNLAWFKYLMNPFVYAGDSNFMIVEDGNISFAYDKDEWKEGLAYIKGLYDEGLIPSITFSQDSSAMTSLLNSPTTVVGAFASTGTGGINSTDKRRVEYMGIAPLENKDGVAIASYDAPSASTRAIFKKNNSNLENAFRFGDLLVSREISIHTRFGEKGVDWLEPAATDKSMYASLGYEPVIVEVLPWSTLQNKHWAQTGPYIREKAISAGNVWSGNPLDHNIVIAEAQLKYEGKNPEEYITKLIFNDEEAEAANSRISTLNDYVKEMVALFITGDKDLDKDWQDYLDQLEAIGTEQVLVAAQAAYDRMAG